VSALPRPCLCLVTDRRRAAPDARTTPAALRELDRQLDEAIDAGIDLIQIRERNLDAAALHAFVAAVVARAPASTRVVVNDRADVAVAAGASGVHLRADGPATARARLTGPAGWVVGRSVHTVEECAAAGDADYLIFGTVFPSASKPLDSPVAGLDALRAACAVSAAPVLAIGGITPERMAACRDAGAAGIAAIGAFLPSPARAIRQMRAAWQDDGFTLERM
jgi:thiamine-phosphate pyrophosphorylase